MTPEIVVDALRRYGVRGAARALGVPRSTLTHLVASAIADGRLVVGSGAQDNAAAVKLEALQRHANTLARLLQYERAAVEIALGLSNTQARPPKWIISPAHNDGSHSMPVLLLGDWHFGEVVRGNEIDGANRYDTEIAEARVRKTIERAIDIARHHMHGVRYDGIVVAFLGDLVSGDIHDELAQTNECSLIEMALRCRDIAHAVIATLRNEFGRVLVPWVFGNHGRTTRKPRYKQAAVHNFDWLIGALLRRDFANDERVTILCPPSGDVVVDIYGWRVRFSHGDRLGVSGGDALIGPIGPIVRGALKMSAQMRSLGSPHDLLVIGHYHQVLWLPNVIVNGSLKGYDEYAYGRRMRYEPPAQGLFFLHRKHGVTARWDIYPAGPEHRRKAEDAVIMPARPSQRRGQRAGKENASAA